MITGNALKCGKKCDSMDDCVGFVRVKTGSQYAGKCYFRGGSLNRAEPYNGDKRSCFAPDPRIRKEASEDNQIYVDEREYIVNHGSMDGLINNGEYDTLSMIIYILCGVFIGLMALYGCKVVLRLKAKWGLSSKTKECATDTTPLIKNGESKV